MSLLYCSPLKSAFPFSEVCGRLHLISRSQNWLKYRRVGTWPCGVGGVPGQGSPWLLAFPEQLYRGKSQHWATEMNVKVPRPVPVLGEPGLCGGRPAVASLSLVLTPAAGETA